MNKRVEWLKLIMQISRPETLPLQILFFLSYEAYYGLCKLRGYPPRHFLDPLPEEVRVVQVGERLLLVWPSLPLSIRVLDRMFPFGGMGHAEFAPYTTEAAASARASGRRVEVMDVVPGELRPGGRGK